MFHQVIFTEIYPQSSMGGQNDFTTNRCERPPPQQLQSQQRTRDRTLMFMLEREYEIPLPISCPNQTTGTVHARVYTRP